RVRRGGGKLDLGDESRVARDEAEITRGAQKPRLLIAAGLIVAGNSRKAQHFAEHRDETLRFGAIVLALDFRDVRGEGGGKQGGYECIHQRVFLRKMERILQHERLSMKTFFKIVG